MPLSLNQILTLKFSMILPYLKYYLPTHDYRFLSLIRLIVKIKGLLFSSLLGRVVEDLKKRELILADKDL